MTRHRKKKKIALAAAPPPPSAIDRLSRLPEEILAQILSFLPAWAAVRTCVLARTWRDVWRFTRRLRITATTVHEGRKFVDRLLRARLDGLEVASLEAIEMHLFVDDEPQLVVDRDAPTIYRWIRFVLKRQIQMLRVDIGGVQEGYLADYLQSMGNAPMLASRHLTRLELIGVWFVDELYLDCCPVLEHLEITECFLDGMREITSSSLKRLVITSCNSTSREDQKRIRICVPRLVSLWLELDHNSVRTPLLERMPELVAAKVGIISSLDDDCYCEDPMACDHVMRDGDISDSDDEEGSCDYASQNTTKCMVLEGLAQAKDLLLIADRSMFIFRRDLRWCPIFFELKTLVLNLDYWCQPADCRALACILEHAPVLEKLKLIPYQLPTARGKYKVEMKAHSDATENSNKISQHLKMVEINCENLNGIFLTVLNFFGALNIYFAINVTKNDEGTRNDKYIP